MRVEITTEYQPTVIGSPDVEMGLPEMEISKTTIVMIYDMHRPPSPKPGISWPELIIGFIIGALVASMRFA